MTRRALPWLIVLALWAYAKSANAAPATEPADSPFESLKSRIVECDESP